VCHSERKIKAKGVQEKVNGNGGSKGSKRSKEKLSELFCALSLSLTLFHIHRVLCPRSETAAAGTRNTKAQRQTQ